MNVLPEEHCAHRDTAGTQLGHLGHSWVLGPLHGRCAVKEQRGFLGMPG